MVSLKTDLLHSQNLKAMNQRKQEELAMEVEYEHKCVSPGRLIIIPFRKVIVIKEL
jgi:hypothetical protein